LWHTLDSPVDLAGPNRLGGRHDILLGQMMASVQGLLHVKLVQRAYELSDALGTLARQDHLPEIGALLETLAGAHSLIAACNGMGLAGWSAICSVRVQCFVTTSPAVSQ
jgi:hypothetical protein